MSDKQPFASLPPQPPTGAPPAPSGPLAASGPSAYPPPPPRPRRNGLLFGCLGAAVLVLVVGLIAAGGAIFLARRTAARAEQVLGTSVVAVSALATSAATAATQPTVIAVQGGAGPAAAGTVAVPNGAASSRITPTPTAVIAIGATAAPTSRPAAAHPAGPNQPVVVPGWTVMVTGVERPGQGLPIAADPNTDPVAATGTWVVVALKVTRTANGAEGADYDAFALRSGQGFTYAIPQEYWTSDGYYPAFKHGQPYGKAVPPGATVTYYLTFDVAADATDLQFIFLPDSANPAVIAIGGAAH